MDESNTGKQSVISTEEAIEATCNNKKHEFVDATFRNFTYCYACGKFIWGPRKQGKRCKFCDIPVHHRCFTSITENCAERSLADVADDRSKSHNMEETESDHPHSFICTTFSHGTWCDHCKQFCWGLFNQGMVCEICGMHIHHKCEPLAAKNCMSALWKHKSISEAFELSPKLDSESGDSPEMLLDLNRDGEIVEETENSGVSGKDGIAADHIHSFNVVSLNEFTNCSLCKKFIWGPVRQAVRCKVCNYVAHHRCGRLITAAESQRREEQRAEQIKVEAEVAAMEKEEAKSKKVVTKETFMQNEKDAMHNEYTEKRKQRLFEQQVREQNSVKIEEITVDSIDKSANKCSCVVL